MRQELSLENWFKRDEKEKVENRSPWISGAYEIGFVTAPRKLSVVVGEAKQNYIWIKAVREHGKVRIGYPLIVYDYRFDEYIAGLVMAMGYDIEDPTLYERSAEPEQPLTTELVSCNDTSFLELSPLYGLEPICSFRRVGGEIVKESVNFAPHIRAPAFIPPIEIVHEILGVPKCGIPYGVVVVGSDILHDPLTGSFIVYRVREPVLFEHELVIGSTGKGKTAKCKNDIYFFVKRLNGAVIVFDMHDEYTMISEEPNYESAPIRPGEVDVRIWRSIDAFPDRIEDVVVWQWAKNYEEGAPLGVRLFTIKFSEIPPRALQYYLPALSPQGYVVLPRLVRMFRESDEGETFQDFFLWLSTAHFDKTVIVDRTREALLRRMAPILEEGVFDGEGLEDIDAEQLLIPGRVSVFRLSHIPNNTVRRIVVLHVLRKIAELKLRDSDGRYPPTMILIDEAHNFFPRNLRDEDERHYIGRAIGLVDRICKEGRKFRLRIQFSTQSPEDLHPDVIKTVNTITFFGVNPVQANILERVMELPVPKSEIMNLPTRRAIIYSRSNADAPVKVLIPWPLLKHKITKPTF